MKKLLVLILSAVMGCSSSPTSKGVLSFLSSSSIELRPYRVETLPNGMKIYFVRDETLPRVSLRMLLKSGAAQDPEGLEGVNALTAALLDKGTTKRSAVQLAEELNALGTEFGARPGDETTSTSASTLTPQAEQLLELFADIMMNPAFAQKEVDRQRSQFVTNLKRRVDNPAGFAGSEYERFLFGDKHPYGRDNLGSESSLAKVKRVDVLRHYLSWYRPNNVLMAVTGRYGEDFEKKVVETFGGWKSRELKPVALPSLAGVAPGVTMRLVSRPALVQAQLRFGQIGVPRNHPDYDALLLGSEVLGGGFGARLMQRIRDDLGLTYGISSAVSSNREGGSFTIGTSTRNDAVGKTVGEVLAIYKKLLDEGVTEAELNVAKAQLIGQYPRALETADAVASQLLLVDFFQLPLRRLTNFPQIIERISVSEVNAAMRRAFAGQGVKVLVYGDKRAISGQLKEWNPEVVDFR